MSSTPPSMFVCWCWAWKKAFATLRVSARHLPYFCLYIMEKQIFACNQSRALAVCEWWLRSASTFSGVFWARSMSLCSHSQTRLLLGDRAVCITKSRFRGVCRWQTMWSTDTPVQVEVCSSNWCVHCCRCILPYTCGQILYCQFHFSTHKMHGVDDGIELECLSVLRLSFSETTTWLSVRMQKHNLSWLLEWCEWKIVREFVTFYLRWCGCGCGTQWSTRQYGLG